MTERLRVHRVMQSN